MSSGGYSTTHHLSETQEAAPGERVMVLKYHRNSEAWAKAVLKSSPACEAIDAGFDVSPAWAHGAKILVPGMTEALFLKHDVHLRPYHVVVRESDRHRLDEALRAEMPYQGRPRVRESMDLGPEEAVASWSYVEERTFVEVVTKPNSGPMTVSSADANPKHKNPRRMRQEITTVGTGSSIEDGRARTIEEHAGEMKKYQGFRDLPGVLQCLGNILRDGLKPDAYCYTIVIDTCAKLGQHEDAERWLNKMKEESVVPGAVAYQCVMRACGESKQPARAEMWFEEMQMQGIKPTTVGYNVLINAYAEAGQIERAEEWFNKLCFGRRLKLNVQSFSPFINAYAQRGEPNQAQIWVDKQVAAGFKMDKPCLCMMMNAHANAGSVDQAQYWFDRIRASGYSIQVTDYTQLLKACGRARDATSACAIFCTMINEGIEPDHFNIVTLLNASGMAGRQMCSELGIDTGKARVEFDATGEEFNFDQDQLKRKTWKINPGEGLIRSSFESSVHESSDSSSPNRQDA